MYDDAIRAQTACGYTVNGKIRILDVEDA
ncbi:uncharacterized protein METZ01_LOCUS252762, partial [marine metagenome]